MSAKDKMRSMLDELMGTNRDGENKDRTVSFDSRIVCKSYLLECCPHEILSGTRMDLGECMYVHDPALKADYRTESLKKDFYFEIDALSHLESFIGDCDRRVEAAKAKLSDTQEELSEEAQIKADHINSLGEQIGTKLAKAENLGTQGEVNESLKLMKEVEALREEKASAENELKNIIPVTTYQQQKLRVCEACSAYLGIHDNDRRLADHFGGKLHVGFIQIRQKLDELRKYVDTNNIMTKARLAMLQDGSRRDRDYDSGYRERDRDRERPNIITRGGEYKEGRDRGRGRSRSRRSRSKEKKSRSRSRSRSSHHKKHKKHKKHKRHH